MVHKLLVKTDFEIVKNWLQEDKLRRDPSLNPVCPNCQNLPILTWPTWVLNVSFSSIPCVSLSQNDWMESVSPSEWCGSCSIPEEVAVLAVTLPNPRRSWASVAQLLCRTWGRASTEVFSVTRIHPKIPVLSLPVFPHPCLSSTIKNIKCCREHWISNFIQILPANGIQHN